ncbi:MAG: HDIG domain-containing metalloprotein [Syntrophobacteria bacterium]
MKLLLNVILVLVTFFSCYIENIYLSLLPPHPGDVIPFTIRAQGNFNFDQEKALGGKRKMALSQYVPLYTYVPDRRDEANERISSLIKKVSSLQQRKSSAWKELARYLQDEFGVEVHRRDAVKLLQYRKLESTLEGIMTVEESILRGKVAKDSEPFQGKNTIEVLYPEPTGIVVNSTNEVITLETAKLLLQEKVNQLFWQVDSDVLNLLLEISLTTLLPNLEYDHTENDKRIESIIQRYPLKVITFGPGDTLVPSRKVLVEEDVLLLSAYQEEEKTNLYGDVAWILTAILLIVVFYNLLLSKILGSVWQKKPPNHLLLASLIITIFILKACLLLTPLPIVVVPFAFLPFLLILLQNERTSVAWTTVMGAMLVCLFAGRTLEILLFFIFGGLSAVLVTFKLRKRIHILLPSLVVGIINAAIIMAFTMHWESVVGFLMGWQKVGAGSLGEVLNTTSLTCMGWAFIGGIVAGPFAILVLPLLELSWHTASTFRLNKFADLQHPLLRDLLTKAPATYQHTMTVAYLAQSVGEATGANTLLLRIGAYYHDIGKMVDPKLFTENQSDGENPHDDLGWQESANLIINHVKYGEKRAREFGVPDIIVDFIQQHHGTQLMEYFYNKAVENSQGIEFDEEDFRYPGPKPQSIEAAILMIVDAVEAASRSIKEPTREKIDNMIRLLIVNRIEDGQFDECHLSTHYLGKIVQTLVDSMEAALHSRVTYSWQNKEKK